MKKVLFISSNDGTDTRIYKEIKSLSETHEVIFIGVKSENKPFINNYCQKIYLIQAKRNSLFFFFSLNYLLIKILLRENISSLHIVNEQLLIFILPFAYLKNTVLDIFDSIFLKLNSPKNKLFLLKYLLYRPVKWIIVTDKQRRELLPTFAQKKSVVINNYPYFQKIQKRKIKNYPLSLLFVGWLGENRGGALIKGLLESKDNVKIYAAGWFSDDFTKNLIKKFPKQIEYLGVKSQQDIIKIGSLLADYILCVYEPLNSNNINASPNKIYDAIQMNIPVIINNEIKVSSFVKEKKIGYVIDDYYNIDYKKLYTDLVSQKNNFLFDTNMKHSYSWEIVEKKLQNAHY